MRHGIIQSRRPILYTQWLFLTDIIPACVLGQPTQSHGAKTVDILSDANMSHLVRCLVDSIFPCFVILEIKRVIVCKVKGALLMSIIDT